MMHGTMSLKKKNTFLFDSPQFRKERFFKKVPRLRPLVLLVWATCTWRWLRSTAVMMLTGENLKYMSQRNSILF